MLRGRTAGCGFGHLDSQPFGHLPRELRIDVRELRHHALAESRGTCTLVSSKRNARTMCACSTGVWLL